MDRRIFHIKNKLSRDLTHAWCIEDMADEVRMSVPHFRRLFKKDIGKAPNLFLTELRLEKAREMLSDLGCFLQVKEIGVLVGLTNESHFTKSFKAKVGMTPTAFRAYCSEINQSGNGTGNE